MKSKLLIAVFLVPLIYCNGYTQSATNRLYKFSITRTVNDENNRIDKYVEVDSSGNLYVGETNMVDYIDSRKFSQQINKYVKEEKISKHPGNNDISFLEIPTPKLNEQTILITVIFLNDFYKEKILRNKTYYSLGKSFDKNIIDYPLFKYLDEGTISKLKDLLK